MSSDQGSASHQASPTEETLRQQLQLQWQDHFQTREQTWKALQMVSVILLAAIGADFKLHDRPALLLLGSIVAIATFFGMAVTIHHRKVQVQKFKLIFKLEERLGLHTEGLLEGVHRPKDFHWSSIFNIKHMASPTYILIMHILVLIFIIVYVWVRMLS